MRAAVPRYFTLMQPLADLLDTVYKLSGKSRTLDAANVSLSKQHWSEKHEIAFENRRHSVESRVTLAQRDTTQCIFVFTDASDNLRSGVLPQVPPADVSSAYVDQRHQSLALLFGRFTGTQLLWSILENEAFELMATVDRMHRLLATSEGFDLHTDQKNQIFLFDPLPVVSDLSQSSLRNVLRWTVRLSAFHFTFVHIIDPENV